jgi:REP element-mobilizing transposase RayT
VPRGLRRDLPDGVFHVTCRGTGGIHVFLDDLDRAAFTLLLKQTSELFTLRLSAWCLLGTHFHLIAGCPREELSLAMHRLNGLHAQRFNRRHGRKGHLFEERFSSWVIESERHLNAAIRYVLENPVAAGLCREPDDWTWSWPRYRTLAHPDIRGTVPGTWPEPAGAAAA